MFLLFQLLESIKFIKKVQTNKNYFLFFLIKRILFFTETNNFSLSFLLRYLGLFLLIPKYFSFCFKGFLFENFRYSINLTNIISLALTNILGAPSILYIARGNILSFALFTANTRNYVSFSSFSYCIAKRNRTIIAIFGWYNRKERKS
jgi:hypothetical protein